MIVSTTKEQTALKSKFDLVIYFAAIVAPVMTVPQLYKIWSDKQVSGVSIQTWATYSAISLIWVLYGIKIKAKPIILTNALLLLIDTLIVIGVIVYS